MVAVPLESICSVAAPELAPVSQVFWGWGWEDIVTNNRTDTDGACAEPRGCCVCQFVDTLCRDVNRLGIEEALVGADNNAEQKRAKEPQHVEDREHANGTEAGLRKEEVHKDII